MREPDPGEQARRYGADLTGTLITLFPVSDETVFQADLAIGQRRIVRLDTNKDLLPPEDAPVSLIVMAADAGEKEVVVRAGPSKGAAFTVPYTVTEPAALYESDLVRVRTPPPLGPLHVREKPYPVVARCKSPVRHAPAEAPQSREPASATPLPPATTGGRFRGRHRRASFPGARNRQRWYCEGHERSCGGDPPGRPRVVRYDISFDLELLGRFVPSAPRAQ